MENSVEKLDIIALTTSDPRLLPLTHQYTAIMLSLLDTLT